MPDVPSITAAITGIKTAMEIAKGFRESDLSYEKAEAKLKLAELMDALADAKINIADIKILLQEKDDELGALCKALEDKNKLARIGEVYYEIDEAGGRKGSPYCSKCWEVARIQVHLNRMPTNLLGMSHRCPHCGNTCK